jgi:hypothetical protein
VLALKQALYHIGKMIARTTTLQDDVDAKETTGTEEMQAARPAHRLNCSLHAFTCLNHHRSFATTIQGKDVCSTGEAKYFRSLPKATATSLSEPPVAMELVESSCDSTHTQHGSRK